MVLCLSDNIELVESMTNNITWQGTTFDQLTVTLRSKSAYLVKHVSTIYI